MTVGELKELLEGLDDEMEVLIPLDSFVYDGKFMSPCIEESGVVQLDNPDNILSPSETTFLLVPCGFFDDIDDEFDNEIIPELN